MKISKKQLSVVIISLAILICASTLLVLQYALPFDFMTHPVLNFVFVLTCGFGLMTLILAIISKSSFKYFITAILFSLSIVYIFVQFAFWWVGLILSVVISVVLSLIGFISVGSTDTLLAENNSPEYKDFEQRQALKDEKEQSEEKKELPKIKSFK